MRRKLKQSIAHQVFSNAAQAQLHAHNNITERWSCQQAFRVRAGIPFKKGQRCVELNPYSPRV